MKFALLFLMIAVFISIAGCTSEPSTNPNPRRTYNAETGNFEGPTPMPPPGGNTSGSRY